MSKKYVRLSKSISLVLRHSPELIGIKLDKEGWVYVYEDNKQRYVLDLAKGRIRANQGHSTRVNLTYKRRDHTFQ